MTDRGKLGEFLKEVIQWEWSKFCIEEKNDKYTGLQATVFALVRTSSKGKLNAIKLAIDRVDGKLETPIKIVYPKVYFLYPHAESRALPPANTPPSKELLADLEQLNEAPQVSSSEGDENDQEEDIKIASMSLRQTLEKLADSPRNITSLILARKEEVEKNPTSFLNVDSDDAAKKVPLVKSVIAANLMSLAQDNNFDAITEIFEQIDGKLVETFHVLGEDVYLTRYELEAPWDAVKNKDGVFEKAQPMISDLWEEKLGAKNGKKRTR